MRVRQDSTSASSPAQHLSSQLHVGCDANVVFDRSAGALLLQVSPRLPAEGHSSHCTADAECGPRRVAFLPTQCCVPVPLLLRLFHQLLAITEPRHRCACGVTPLRARHSCLRSHPDATSSALGVSRTHLSATGTEHLAEHTWQRLMWRLCCCPPKLFSGGQPVADLQWAAARARAVFSAAERRHLELALPHQQPQQARVRVHEVACPGQRGGWLSRTSPAQQLVGCEDCASSLRCSAKRDGRSEAVRRNAAFQAAAAASRTCRCIRQ